MESLRAPGPGVMRGPCPPPAHQSPRASMGVQPSHSGPRASMGAPSAHQKSRVSMGAPSAHHSPRASQGAPPSHLSPRASLGAPSAHMGAPPGHRTPTHPTQGLLQQTPGPGHNSTMPLTGSFAPFVRSMMIERFRSPGFAAMLAANRLPFPPGPPGLPSPGTPQGFPQGFPPPDPRCGVFPPPPPFLAPFPGFLFSQEDLDMVLYGYARGKGRDKMPGHALSGLRTSELAYGMDRILPGCPVTPKQAMGPVDPATVELPENLELFHTTFAGTVHHGVFCKKNVIPKGTRFGPFLGKVVNTSEIKSNDDNSFMWEIFKEGKLSHFVDGRGATGNWMSFVNCARYAQEQNLLAVQGADDQIYYETCKDVSPGTELLVWYGDCYLQFMGIPVALKDMGDPGAGTTQQEAENSEGYQCERCGKVFAYKYYRDKHLKYTRCVDMGDRKFPCHLCSRSFEKRDRLRIHILHVHEKHRPHKCNVCGKSFSQSSSLNKHMRVHSGERPYKCVYCSKAFTASSILRTHIRQHSGEKPFKCKHCGKAFASHAAHDSHVRRTHTKDKPSQCTICGKSFTQAYELKFHMRTHDMGLDGLCMGGSSYGRQFSDVNMNDKLLEEPIDVVGTGQEPINMTLAV